MLTLRQAIEQGHLADFVRQEEARQVPPAVVREFEAVMETTVKPPQHRGSGLGR